MANSATSPIRSSATLTCRSAASRTGIPPSSVTRSPGLSPARSAADCGSTWRTTAPGGRTLLARRFLLFGVQFLGHRQRPHLGIVPHALNWGGSSALAFISFSLHGRHVGGVLGRVDIVAGLRGRYRGLGNGLVLLRWIGSA